MKQAADDRMRIVMGTPLGDRTDDRRAALFLGTVQGDVD
jgi:hypothetical protein